MAPTVVAGAIAAALSQALQAMGQFRSAAIAVITATIVGALTNAGTVFFPSLWVFAASDLALSAVMGAASLILLRMNANGARHG
jgi:uncharacterized membrane protein YeaQ/YmgE (transglycosylase-associated protein family)